MIHCFNVIKILSLPVLSFCSSAAIAQDSTSFRLILITFNHAEQIYKGSTTYLLTSSSIKVTNTPFLDSNKSKLVYYNKFSKPGEVVETINKLTIDSLQEVYYNYCIMPTSGNEYILEYLSHSKSKQITLHHYYLKQLHDIVEVINSHLPRKYQIQYLQKDTKQDCSL